MRGIVILLLSCLTLACCGEKRTNKYAGTAEQAGVMHLHLCGREIAIGLRSFYNTNGKWPASLSELLPEGILKEHDLLYPRRYDLPDRRDFSGFTDGIRWIYLRPKDETGRLPLLIAPLPITSSMGGSFPKPKRIIVGFDGAATMVEEDKIADIIQSFVGG